MQTPVDVAARGRQLTAPRLWLLAVLLYGVGDAVTTVVGLTVGGLTEVGPLAAPLIERYGLVVVPAVKVGVFGMTYAVWRLIPQPQRLGVPLGLSAAGLAVTVWNGAFLAMVLLR